jgi:hypothetical protein
MSIGVVNATSIAFGGMNIPLDPASFVTISVPQRNSKSLNLRSWRFLAKMTQDFAPL